jgi:hypothetical protein
MSKKRSSPQKREREFQKRQRERKKAEKAAQKRERRQNRGHPHTSAVAIGEDGNPVETVDHLRSDESVIPGGPESGEAAPEPGGAAPTGGSSTPPVEGE